MVRPLISEAGARQRFSCRISPETLKLLKAERDRTGKSYGLLIDSAMEALQYCPKLWFPGKEEP